MEALLRSLAKPLLCCLSGFELISLAGIRLTHQTGAPLPHIQIGGGRKSALLELIDEHAMLCQELDGALAFHRIQGCGPSQRDSVEASFFHSHMQLDEWIYSYTGSSE
ncbi:hypothetical protein ACSSS7_004140 [Eimeria intestinalis]